MITCKQLLHFGVQTRALHTNANTGRERSQCPAPTRPTNQHKSTRSLHVSIDAAKNSTHPTFLLLYRGSAARAHPVASNSLAVRPRIYLCCAANPPRCVAKQRSTRIAHLGLQQMQQSSTGCQQRRCAATCLRTHQSCTCRATLRPKLPPVRLASPLEHATVFPELSASLSFRPQSHSRCSINCLPETRATVLVPP